jgi:alpha-galactosidase
MHGIKLKRVNVMHILVLLLITLPDAQSLDNGLALTPPRGWRSWNLMLLNVSQRSVLAQAAALAKEYPDLGPSLLQLNYSEIGIDDGWQECGVGVNGTFHDASGRAIWDATKFPDARAMVKEAEETYGVGIGWYGNNCECAERQGHDWPWFGEGHPRRDSQMAFELGFSGIKIDGCGPQLNMTLWTSELLRAGNSKILIEDCLDKSFWARDSAPPTPTRELLRSCPSHFYRITRDIAPDFYSTMFNVNFMTRQLAPYYTDASAAPRPGCWAYPDMLEVGVPPMTVVQSRTHFAVWCVLSAPLILGFDLTDEITYRAAYPVSTPH